MMPILTYEISLVAQLAFSEISRELFIGQFAGLLVLITAAIAIPIIGEIIRIDEDDDLSNRLSKYTFSSIPVRAVGSGVALWAASAYMGLSISAVSVIASTVATIFAGIALLEIARAARTALNI